MVSQPVESEVLLKEKSLDSGQFYQPYVVSGKSRVYLRRTAHGCSFAWPPVVSVGFPICPRLGTHRRAVVMPVKGIVPRRPAVRVVRKAILIGHEMNLTGILGGAYGRMRGFPKGVTCRVRRKDEGCCEGSLVGVNGLSCSRSHGRERRKRRGLRCPRHDVRARPCEQRLCAFEFAQSIWRAMICPRGQDQSRQKPSLPLNAWMREGPRVLKRRLDTNKRAKAIMAAGSEAQPSRRTPTTRRSSEPGTFSTRTLPAHFQRMLGFYEGRGQG